MIAIERPHADNFRDAASTGEARRAFWRRRIFLNSEKFLRRGCDIRQIPEGRGPEQKNKTLS